MYTVQDVHCTSSDYSVIARYTPSLSVVLLNNAMAVILTAIIDSATPTTPQLIISSDMELLNVKTMAVVLSISLMLLVGPPSAICDPLEDQLPDTTGLFFGKRG